MINSIKNRIYVTIKKTSDKAGLAKLQTLLQDQLENTLDNVLSNRRADTENTDYSPADLQKITDKYMRMNVAIATASSFVPGPAGIITAVPSMINSINNQLKASYDIACAHGKETAIDTDILLNVMLQSRGVPTGISNLNQINKLGSASAISDQVVGLSQVVARKKIKSALTSMIPGLSTVFAVIEAKKETMKVVTTSCTFYDPTDVIETTSTTFQFSEEDLYEEKLKLLINLLTIDGKAAPEEVSFITPLIKNSTLSVDKKEIFSEALWKPYSDYNIDFELIRQSGDADEAMVDLAVLTKRDKVIAPEELEYVQFAAKELNIDDMVYQKILDESHLEGVVQ